MIRTALMLLFWGFALPLASVICLPWTFITGDIRLLYRVCMWGASAGVRLAGVRVQTIGLEKLDPKQSYIFMSNHASNIDPPLMLPLIPGRTSVMVKQELFRYPLLAKIMRIGELVPVDRGNRDAGIAAVQTASAVVHRGINMTIYVEGKRSFDGKLLPFKKGPFYLAMECNVPVVPVTIAGTHYVMPKRRFAIKSGKVDVIFHDPILPHDFGSRECLMEKVRREIDSGLPPEYQEQTSVAADTLPVRPGQAPRV
jgi:1-acyl-sn-glycerol-3-phosphate acyltransferase